MSVVSERFLRVLGAGWLAGIVRKQTVQTSYSGGDSEDVAISPLNSPLNDTI